MDFPSRERPNVLRLHRLEKLCVGTCCRAGRLERNVPQDVVRCPRYANRSREIGTLSRIMRTGRMAISGGNGTVVGPLCLGSAYAIPGLNLSPFAMQIRTVRCRALACFAFMNRTRAARSGPPFLLSGMKSLLTSPRLVSARHARAARRGGVGTRNGEQETSPVRHSGRTRPSSVRRRARRRCRTLSSGGAPRPLNTASRTS